MANDFGSPHLSVVIPAYNEEKRISDTLDDIQRYLLRQTYSSEILVVDDGSKDATVEIVTKIIRRFVPGEKKIQRLKIVQYPDGKNRGKGYAVRYGILQSTGAYRLFMDADNSTTISHVEQFLSFLEEGYDMVIGSRDIEGSEIVVHQSWIKELAGNMGNLFIRIVAVPGIRDTQAGFKIFTEKTVKHIFPLLTINRWGFDVEILALGKHFGYRIKEAPITWVNNEDSKVSASAYIPVIGEVLRVRWNLMRGYYNRTNVSKEKNFS